MAPKESRARAMRNTRFARERQKERKNTPDPPTDLFDPQSHLSLLCVSLSPPTQPKPNPIAPPPPTCAPPPQPPRRSPRATTSRTPASLSLVRSSSSAICDGGAPSAAEERQRRPPPRIRRAPGTTAPYAGGSAAPTAVEEQPAVLLPPQATHVPAPPPDLISTRACYCFHTGFVQLVKLVLLPLQCRTIPREMRRVGYVIL